MKLLQTFLILLIPITTFAQDTAQLKHQAQTVADAVVSGNYDVVALHTYPKIVASVGGKDKMIETIQKGMDAVKAQGFTFSSATVGSPGKFYKAGSEIHCIIPETIQLTSANGKLISNANLLAITKDGGIFWYFLDINRNTYNIIPQLFPNFNKALVMPEPTPPVMQ